jgi:hypothetical protein
MQIHWSALGRQPQTYLLLLGTALGYAALIGISGNRPLVWLGGGAVATVMVGSWVSGYRAVPRTAEATSDLLDASAFQAQIAAIHARVVRSGLETWQPVKTWALQSQTYAAQICEREPMLRVELLEALYTVVDLAQQVADALKVIAQIQTPAYREMAQQRLQLSCDRMQQTHAQLQQLQDQIALASLEASQTAALPQRLQTLIHANKQILETPPE